VFGIVGVLGADAIIVVVVDNKHEQEQIMVNVVRAGNKFI